MVDPNVRPGPSSMRVKRPGDRRNVSRSATRALDVLEQFGEARGPLRAVDIVRHLDLHPSTVNQLLKTMVDSAHLTFDALGKTYLPSPRLARFSGWLVESYGADGALRDLMQQVHAATGCVVTLTSPNDLHMQVVDMAGAELKIAAERGLMVSIFETAIGAAYLSLLDDKEIVRLAYRARIAEIDNVRLIDMAHDVRCQGFAAAPSANGAIWSIAVPLSPSDQRAPLVLGLAGPSAGVQDNIVPFSKRLMDAARCYGSDG